VITKGILLTQVSKVDEGAKRFLLNVDLLVADADGLVSHTGRSAWLAFSDGDWESESERIHLKLTGLLEKRLTGAALFETLDLKT
jgi:hypothetical protein